LLQLKVGQVIPHHHFQHCEQLAVCDEAVLVDVVDLEGEAQFVFFVGAVQGCQTCLVLRLPDRNSLKEILPFLSLSKIEMTRFTRGFWLSSGTLKISSGSRSPELSSSICLKRAYSFWISF
jgi:hypothetical protein